MPTPKLTTAIVNAAILGMEAQKEKLDAKIAELRAWLAGGSTESAAAAEPTRKRKKFSAAPRRKMAMAQKARWAKVKGEPEPSAPATPEAAKPKRRISKEGMARIVAATKRRWDAVRAAKAQQEKAATKKPAKKAAVKKPANKSPPVKKATAKKTAAKKTAPAAAQGATETGGQ